MSASMTIKGTNSASARLRGIAKRVKNAEPALRAVADTLEDHVSQTFATHGAYGGRGWKPLTTAYTARKGAGSPLVLSGGLKASFHEGPWHIEQVSPSALRWGTRHPLAHLHQKGTPGRRIPARPIAVVTWKLRRQVRDELKAYILKG